MRIRVSSRALTLTLTIFAASLLLLTTAAAQQEKVLHSFNSNGKDGCYPYSTLVFDSSGNLYGTTTAGGTHSGGTVFELAPLPHGGWGERVVYNFGATATDGHYPVAGLMLDRAGNLFGTTLYGGVYGVGTVFELIRRPGGHWTEVVLYSFGGGSDGANPNGGLVIDAKRNLYGTTVSGGKGTGTVFEVSPTPGGGWTEKTLYSFLNDNLDGANPMGPVTFDSAGNLYGTTLYGGGSGNCGGGCGVVFQLAPDLSGEWTETILHAFSTGWGDGVLPQGGLFMDAAGDLFATTTRGGGFNISGTVIEVSPATGGGWSEKVAYTFTGYFGSGDGDEPMFVTLVPDTAGNLYGTTAYDGGYTTPGTAFKLSLQPDGTWTESILHTFNGTDGESPFAGLVMDSKGNLYGTTVWGGGTANCGTVFEIGLKP